MINRLSPKPETSEKLKARQYGASTLICVLAIIIMTVIRLLWGDILFGSDGDTISLGIIIFYARNIVLLFGAIDLVSAIYHFIIWNQNGRKPMEDDNDSLFADWKSGERSQVKTTLALLALASFIVLMFVVSTGIRA